MILAARHAQVLADQIRHGWRTRAPYDVPAARKVTSWQNARRSGLDWHEVKALAQLARQDRIRLRALCAGLRALLHARRLGWLAGYDEGLNEG